MNAVIKINGWRKVSHSYALVNQFQILHWRKSLDIDIYHEDAPFIFGHWSDSVNPSGFKDIDVNIIDKNDCVPEEFLGQYNIYAPLNFESIKSHPVVTFAVTELGFPDEAFGKQEVESYFEQGGLIHTPSNWSRHRLVAAGIPKEIIHVIPHSADPEYFYKIDNDINIVNRAKLGFNSDDVVLLNVGSHFWNKGMDLLVLGFAAAKKRNKNLKLILKDQRATYLLESEEYVKKLLISSNFLDSEIYDSIIFIRDHLDLVGLNNIYNIADLYVSPYRAEGFNLPALEAQTCGTPVLATMGGATDDFLFGTSNHFLPGRKVENANIKEGMKINSYIEPDLNFLIELLGRVEPKCNNHSVHPPCSWVDSCQAILNLLKKGALS